MPTTQLIKLLKDRLVANWNNMTQKEVTSFKCTIRQLEASLPSYSKEYLAYVKTPPS